jgi:putative ABC transport system ATP-binding protein
MIRVDQLDLEIDGKPILAGVSFEVAAGDKVALFGESGSGKTSLLKVLIGLHRPQRGRVEIGGLPLAREHLPAIRRQLFYMPQEVRPIGEETAEEFVDFIFSFAVSRADRPRREEVAELFERFRLKPELLGARMSTLSGGERQRLGLVRGLLLGRSILLLDEVTAAVDEQNKTLIVDHLLGLEGATLVAVTHDPGFIERADVRIEVDDGRFVRLERS